MKVSCLQCKKKFDKNAKKQVYCSNQCRRKAFDKRKAEEPKVPRVGLRDYKAFCDQNKTNLAALLDWLKSNYSFGGLAVASGFKTNLGERLDSPPQRMGENRGYTRIKEIPKQEKGEQFKFLELEPVKKRVGGSDFLRDRQKKNQGL